MSPSCPRFHSLFLLLSIVLQCILSVCGEIRTIDDTYGDSVTGATPVYSSEDCWNKGPGCWACNFQPSPLEAHNGTWHDTTSNVCDNQDVSSPSTHTVTFSFTGTALTVYCLMVLQGPLTQLTNLSFTLDGEISNAVFTPSATASTYSFQYNFNVFSISSLSNEQHTFAMSAITGSSASVLLFDYAEYTYEDPMPAIPSPTSTTSTSSSTSSTLSSTSATSTDSPSPESTTSFSESRSSGSRSSQTTASSSSSATQSGTSEAGVSTFGSTNPATTSVPSALGSHSASHTTIVAGAAAGGSVAVFLVLVGVLIYIRRKKRAQPVPTTNILRKSRYDNILDDGDGDGDDSSAQPLDGGNSPEGTGQMGGRPPRRSRSLMILTDLRASGSTVLSIPLMFNKNNEVGSAESLSAEVDARSGYRHEHDVPALPSSSDGDTYPDTAVQSLDGGNVSSADRRDGAVWRIEMAALRQEMTQEMARLREQTAVYAMVPPPPYV